MRTMLMAALLGAALALLPALAGCSGGGGDETAGAPGGRGTADTTGGRQAGADDPSAGGSGPAPGATAGAQAQDTTQVAAPVLVARSCNRFALALYEELGAEPGNLFLSPLSVAVALAMAWTGAEGVTAEQMAAVLRLPPHRMPWVDQAFGDLIRDLKEGQRDATLRLADRAWIQQGFDLLPAYLATLEQHYETAPGRVDFRGAPQRAAGEINAWVSEQTAGKIERIVSADAIGERTAMILTNAIYLAARWQDEFPAAATAPRPFRAPGGELQVPTMSRQATLPYLENEELQLLVMPYAGSTLQMVVLLPRRDDGLADVARSLGDLQLRRWLEAAERRPIEVELPRFTERTRFDLGATLKAMGMPDALDPARADFSAITGARDLFIQAVLHEAYVDVDEEGTEAAAVTALQMGVTSVEVGNGQEPVLFRADHPFLFLIRDRRTEAIVFLGRIENPRTGEG